VLGSFVGSREFEVQHFSELVDSNIAYVKSITELRGDPHAPTKLACINLLRLAQTSKLTFVSRVMLPSISVPLCAKFDAAVRSAFVSITEQRDKQLNPAISDLAWEQATLPISMGGFGLIPAALTAPIAFADSVTDFIERASLLGFSEIVFPPSMSPAIHAASELVAKYPRRPFRVNGIVAISHVQKHIATAIHSERKNIFAAKLSQHDLARFTSQCSFPSMQWLNAIPSCPDLAMEDSLVKFAVHSYLGTPFPAPVPPVCVCKYALSSSPLPGSHFEVCKCSSIIVSHDHTSRLLMELARAAQHTTSDQSSLLNIASDGSNTRPDGKIYSRLNGDRKDVAFDVEIVHPSPPSHSDSIPLLAARNAERAKTTKHGANCARFNLRFCPFVLEYYGAFGSEASRLFRSLVSELDSDQFIPPNWAARTPFQYWAQRFSMLNARSHAAAVSGVYNAALQFSGIHVPPPACV
jgi:hypothetical protein